MLYSFSRAWLAAALMFATVWTKSSPSWSFFFVDVEANKLGGVDSQAEKVIHDFGPRSTPQFLTHDPLSHTTYWTDNSKIFMAFPGDFPRELVSNRKNIRGLTFDLTTQNLYWVEEGQPAKIFQLSTLKFSAEPASRNLSDSCVIPRQMTIVEGKIWVACGTSVEVLPTLNFDDAKIESVKDYKLASGIAPYGDGFLVVSDTSAREISILDPQSLSKNVLYTNPHRLDALSSLCSIGDNIYVSKSHASYDNSIERIFESENSEPSSASTTTAKVEDALTTSTGNGTASFEGSAPTELFSSDASTQGLPDLQVDPLNDPLKSLPRHRHLAVEWISDTFMNRQTDPEYRFASPGGLTTYNESSVMWIDENAGSIYISPTQDSKLTEPYIHCSSVTETCMRSSPRMLVARSESEVIVADFGGHQITRIARGTDDWKTEVLLSTTSPVHGLALDPRGTLYFSLPREMQVGRLNLNKLSDPAVIVDVGHRVYAMSFGHNLHGAVVERSGKFSITQFDPNTLKAGGTVVAGIAHTIDQMVADASQEKSEVIYFSHTNTLNAIFSSTSSGVEQFLVHEAESEHQITGIMLSGGYIAWIDHAAGVSRGFEMSTLPLRLGAKNALSETQGPKMFWSSSISRPIYLAVVPDNTEIAMGLSETTGKAFAMALIGAAVIGLLAIGMAWTWKTCCNRRGDEEDKTWSKNPRKFQQLVEDFDVGGLEEDGLGTGV